MKSIIFFIIFAVSLLFWQMANSQIEDTIRFNESEVDYFEYSIDPSCIKLEYKKAGQ